MRLGAALIVGAALAVAVPLAANAHVTIDPGQAEAGSYAVITVKVPNESETEATNRVELSLPVDTPFSSVRYVPVAGWSAEIVRETLPKPVMVGETEITEAATSIIWTAEAGSEIAAGQLQLFPVSVGPVPDTGSIVMAAAQTYTDGEVVSWSEEGTDAQYPAPVLYINDAPADDHHGGATAGAAHDEQDEPVEHDEATGAQEPTGAASGGGAGDDVLARILGITGLVVGVVGIIIGVSARRRRSA